MVCNPMHIYSEGNPSVFNRPYSQVSVFMIALEEPAGVIQWASAFLQ